MSDALHTIRYREHVADAARSRGLDVWPWVWWFDERRAFLAVNAYGCDRPDAEQRCEPADRDARDHLIALMPGQQWLF